MYIFQGDVTISLFWFLNASVRQIRSGNLSMTAFESTSVCVCVCVYSQKNDWINKRIIGLLWQSLGIRESKVARTNVRQVITTAGVGFVESGSWVIRHCCFIGWLVLFVSKSKWFGIISFIKLNLRENQWYKMGLALSIMRLLVGWEKLVVF